MVIGYSQNELRDHPLSHQDLWILPQKSLLNTLVMSSICLACVKTLGWSPTLQKYFLNLIAAFHCPHRLCIQHYSLQLVEIACQPLIAFCSLSAQVKQLIMSPSNLILTLTSCISLPTWTPTLIFFLLFLPSVAALPFTCSNIQTLYFFNSHAHTLFWQCWG